MDIELDPVADSDDESEQLAGPSTEVLGAQPAIGTKVAEWFVERSKFIPLRLTNSERKYLRLLDAALSVSEYTDKIDTPALVCPSRSELCIKYGSCAPFSLGWSCPRIISRARSCSPTATLNKILISINKSLSLADDTKS